MSVTINAGTFDRKTFQIADYIHQHCDQQGISFTFSFGQDSSGLPTAAARITSTDAAKACVLAEKWMKLFAKHEKQLSSPTSTEARRNEKGLRKNFDRPVYLQTLCQNISVEGQINMALEILLQVVENARDSQVLYETIDKFFSDAEPDTGAANDVFDRLYDMVDSLVLAIHFKMILLGSHVSSLRSNLSPHSPSSLQGTQDRLSGLRRKVLGRDSHRCAVSGQVDLDREDAYEERYGEYGIVDRGIVFAALEVAHIIPHAINELNRNLELDDAKKQLWSLLNMLSPDLSKRLEGEAIDYPWNAISLNKNIHGMFVRLRVWFTELDPYNAQATRRRYKVEAKKRWHLQTWPENGVVTFRSANGEALPDAQFLRIHRALSYAAALSRAGEAVDDFIQRMGTTKTLADDGGLSMLTSLLNLNLTISVKV